MKAHIDRNWTAIIVTLILCICIALLSSCSITRKVDKSHIKISDEVSLQTDTKTTTQDKTVTTITETTLGEVVTPGVKVQTESQGVFTKSVSGNDTIIAEYDPIKNIIKAQFISSPRKVAVPINKKTVIEADVKKEEVKSVDSTAVKKTDTTLKKKDSRTSYIVFGIVSLLILIALGLLVWRYIKTKMG